MSINRPPLAKLRPTRGAAYDTPALEVGPDFYTLARNVQFRKGFAGRILGSRAAYGTLPVSVLHMQNARIGTTNYWLMFGADEIHALETSNADEVTPTAGLTAVAQPWQLQSTLLNGVPCFTNGLDAPHYWDGNPANPYEELPDWPASTVCAGLVAFRYHLFAFDIDGPAGLFRDLLIWSHAAAPGSVPSSWTPAANNEAGSAQLADTPGPILMALPLGGALIVYKRASMYPVSYVGGNDKFRVGEPLFTSSGVLTRRGACDVNGQHFVVTDGDIILTDGTNRRSVAQGRMKEALFSQLDQDNYENLWVQYHRAKNEVWVGFPEAGNQYANRALVYDVSNDAFGERDLPSVPCAAAGIVNDEDTSENWDDDSGDWDDDSSYWNATNYSFATESVLLGYGTTAELVDTDDAVTLEARVGKHDMDFGNAARLKLVTEIHLRKKEGAGELLVRVGTRNTPTEAIAWSAEVTVAETEQVADFNDLPEARFISVEIRSAGSAPWTLTGFDVFGEWCGFY